MLNGIGDYIDLKHALSPHLRPDFQHMSLEQLKQYIAVNGHCSALVKVLSLYTPCLKKTKQNLIVITLSNFHQLW